MKVLLISSNRFMHPWPVIPFGLCCVASAVEKAGHRVRVLDCCFSRNPAAAIESAVGVFAPDVVGVSVRNIDNGSGCNTLFLLDQVREEVIGPLKAVFSGPIVIGGPAVGINGREMLDFFDLEYAVRGDGETAMTAFLERLANGTDPAGIGGLVLRRNGIVRETPPLPVEDLDSLPDARPHRYINIGPYRSVGSPLQVQTKRGCGLKCSYCTYASIEGRRYRLRSPERVAGEIERLVRETGIRDIEFTDSTFNIPLGHAKAVLRAVIRTGLTLNLRAMGVNPGAVDRELVSLMKTAGFREADVGVESASPPVLRSLGKNFGREEVIRAGRLFREANIPVKWFLLVGAPLETEATIRETFRTISRAASAWDLIVVGVGIRVYKGSLIAGKMTARDPECGGDGFLRPVTFSPPGLSGPEMKRLALSAAEGLSNVYFYDGKDSVPLWVWRAARLVVNTFAPGRPVWRLAIAANRLRRFMGSRRIIGEPPVGAGLRSKM